MSLSRRAFLGLAAAGAALAAGVRAALPAQRSQLSELADEQRRAGLALADPFERFREEARLAAVGVERLSEEQLIALQRFTS